MDLQTPPPSYESVTGLPGAQTTTNPYFNNSRPSAPSSYELDDVIVSAPITTPILPQSHRVRPLPQHVRPYNPISYPVTRSTTREQSKNDSKTCACFFITMVFLLILVAILVAVARSGKPKPKESYSFTNTIERNYDSHEYRDQLWKQNQELLDKFQKQADEILKPRNEAPNWNFDTS